MYVNFGGGDVIVTGRVTSRGAEYKPGEGGKRSVLKFGVDADNKKSVDGTWVHTYANVTVFRDLADKLNNRILPHMAVFIAGKERVDEHNGKPRVEVIADFVGIGVGEEESAEEKFVELTDDETVELPF